MSFSDNLENSLKNLEALDELEAARNRRPKGGRTATVPVENLKAHKYTGELLSQVTRLAHGIKTKVHIFWIGNTLRLDAREHRLELRPTPSGVFAHFLVNGTEKSAEKINLDGNAGALAKRWLDTVGPPPPPAPLPPDLADEIG